MKRLALLSLMIVLILAGCSRNNTGEQVDMNLGNNDVNEVVLNDDTNQSSNEDSVMDETTDTTDDVASQPDDEGVEDHENTTDAGEGTEPEEDPTEGDQSDSTENAAGGNGHTDDTSDGADPTDETNGSEDPGETPEVEVDYTANIAQPYEDLDYSPQDKTTDFPENPEINVKGVFITANTAASSRIHDFVDLLNNTELNALVIDVKNDDGTILFHSAAAEEYVPEANSGAQIDDMEAFMQLMKDNNIYTIARIVTFKSPRYAKKYPERAISYVNSGEVYYADGAYWASPFDQELWHYNVAVAKEAIAYGFNEIQFDYVRFPATGSKLDKSLDFKNPNGNSKSFAIQEFVKYARQEINALDAFVALDVFGWTATTINDSGIGQHWEAMSNVSDYMCPMVYPSHYGPNIFGLPVPDANPYKTVYEAMLDAQERNANIETPAKLRPWLQAFTAKWVKGYIPYRTAEIQAQIQACEDLGIEDYIFWNAANNYYEGWFEQE